MKKILLLLLFVSVSWGQFSTNVIDNPDFDNWAGGDASDWLESNTDAQEITGAEAYEGSSALILGTGVYSPLYQAQTVRSGRRMQFSFYYKNEPGNRTWPQEFQWR